MVEVLGIELPDVALLGVGLPDVALLGVALVDGVALLGVVLVDGVVRGVLVLAVLPVSGLLPPMLLSVPAGLLLVVLGSISFFPLMVLKIDGDKREACRRVFNNKERWQISEEVSTICR